MSNARIGAWMQTASGRQFWPLDPRADEVCIDDIAHSLAQQARYTGHAIRPYSVAEHCVRGLAFFSRLTQLELCQAWLLHDAAEAYVGDLGRPLKSQPELAPYRAIERQIQVVIGQRFGVAPELFWSREIRAADDRMALTEKRDVMGPPPADWAIRGEPAPDRIGYPVGWREAKRAFLRAFVELFGDKEIGR